MKYCAMCRKIVEVYEETKLFTNYLDLIVGTCSECQCFIYQYLKRKNEDE